MVDVRLVAAVMVVYIGLSTAADVWKSRHQYAIPNGMALQCAVVEKSKS